VRKCGGHLRGHITRGWRYYECSGRDTRRRPLAQKCLAKPQNADRLELLVWEEIEKYISDPELIRSAFEHHERNSAQDRGRDDSELEALCRAEQTLKQEDNRLLDAYAGGVIELPQLQERMAITKKKRELLNAEKAKINERTARRKSAQIDLEAVEELCLVVQRGLRLLTFEDKRRILEVLDIRVAVCDDRITVTGILSSDLPALIGNGKGTSDKKEPPSPTTEGSSPFRASPAKTTPRRLPRR
jgi:hypothetical protein